MANVSESVLTRDDASIIGKTVIAEAIGGLFYGKCACSFTRCDWSLMMERYRMSFLHSCSIQSLVRYACFWTELHTLIESSSCRGLQSSIARSVLLATIAVIFLCSTTTIVCNLIQDVVQITGLGDPEYNYMPAMQKVKAISTVSARISVSSGPSCDSI